MNLKSFLFLILFMCAIPAYANLVVNGDFETGGVASGKYQQFSSYEGWSIASDVLEIQHGLGFSGSNTSNYAELDGKKNAIITQSLFLENGKTYDFSFDYLNRMATSGGSGKSLSSGLVTVGLGSLWSITPDINKNVWQTYTNSFLFAGQTGSFLLSVVGGGLSDGYGGFVDNFSLTTTQSSPVPLPGAGILLGSGLLGLVGFRRSRLY